MSNAPTVLMGLFPLIRAVVRSSATATTTTVTADDSGTMFINLGATGAHTYTLPTVTLGKGKAWFFFSGQNSQNTLVTSGTASIMMLNDSASSTTNTLTAVVGGWCLVIGDGTYYYCFEGSGSWAES